MNKYLRVAISILFISQSVTAQSSNKEPKIIEVDFPLSVSLRGIHALTENLVWVSGGEGTVGRSIDGGKSWKTSNLADTDFRDIYAFDENTAFVISAGSPALIFKTTDGGVSWNLKYENKDERVFFDAFDFWDSSNGIAFSDAIDGKFFMLITHNGGETWSVLDSAPEALENEGGFAASGTNMIIADDGSILLGTTTGRLLVSKDRGKTWTSEQSPINSSNPTAGIFSIATQDKSVMMVGGDFQDDSNTHNNAAYLDNDGSWTICANPPGGYRSGVAFIPGTEILITTGPSGSDISFDNGHNWSPLQGAGFHSVSFGVDKNSGWLSGSDGRVAKIRWE